MSHTLAAAPGTAVFAGRTPESRRAPGKEPNKGDKSNLPNEVGGTTLLVRRQTPETLFAAVHEPFEKNSPRLESVRRLAQTKDAVALAITGQPGSAVNDRVLYAFWDKHTAPLTLADASESFTFADRAFIRLSPERVEISGDLRAMKLKVNGLPKLFLNGRAVAARLSNGTLHFPGL